MRGWRAACKFFLILAILFFSVSCRGNASDVKVLFDFESEDELDKLDWSCYTIYSLSDQYAIHGSKSLKLEMFPSEYPGLAVSLREKDWSGFRQFCFHLHNPESREIEMSLRIDDLKEFPGYEDRYNQTFILAAGYNGICIPLDLLKTSGTKRTMNLRTIYRFMIFKSHPAEKTVLFADYLRLER